MANLPFVDKFIKKLDRIKLMKLQCYYSRKQKDMALFILEKIKEVK